MYVATFYSYKGGVGRTLAMVNVAYELAASGQKVLVVDFDLEAPAIHSGTWRTHREDLPRGEGQASSTHPGVVEYVGRFMKTMRAPRAEDHIVDATPEGCEGKIALMPSGALNDDYGRRLSAIDWNELYLKYDGYVMFEDLREQWRMLGYDYVLLDSRTGVTDVGGICTRHLPDAVVMMFRPDDQSLRGTAGVADAIRNERPAPGRDRVRLHFVMAAIPDVDDEDGILERLRERFLRRLKIPEFPARPLLEIRHYPSMDLLQQPIYTRARPRTKLARSFQELTKRIRSANIGDRDGVLERLKRIHELQDDVGVLDTIRRHYPNDLAVLGGLADAYKSVGLPNVAIGLLEEIAKLGGLSFRQLFTLAELRHYTGDRRGSLRSLTDFFQDAHTTDRQSDDGYRFGRRAFALLEILAKGEDRAGYIDRSPTIAHWPAVQRANVAIRLDRSRRERQVQVKILASVLSGDEGSPRERGSWASKLAFARVAVGDFPHAAEYYRSALSEDRAIEDAFNLAMAKWGHSGVVGIDDFRRVLDLREEENTQEERRHDPNDPSYLQAIALAEWFAGQGDEARQHLAEARQRLSAATEPPARPRPHHRSAVSCWSYTRVSASTFIEHCDEIGRLFDGHDVKPVFMRAAEDAEADTQATLSGLDEVTVRFHAAEDADADTQANRSSVSE